jgi:two-component SAPR family response regulator
VFTTATDELAARAFHLKGIDYLLKPIIQADLHQMINKYKNLPKSKTSVNHAIFNEIINPIKP